MNFIRSLLHFYQYIVDKYVLKTLTLQKIYFSCNILYDLQTKVWCRSSIVVTIDHSVPYTAKGFCVVRIYGLLDPPAGWPHERRAV